MISKNAFYNGLFLGGALVVASFSFYMANTKMFLIGKSQLLFIPFLILLFKTGGDARRINGGYIDFKGLFKDMFFAAAIGTFLCTSFEYILFNFIDPDLKIQMAENMRTVFKERGLEGNYLYEKSLEQIENGQYFSLGSTILAYLVKLIAPSALVSAMYAGIMKRKIKLPNIKNPKK